MKKFAFTLSEVLIVLAVLGVVAAITVPNLIQEYQERATVVKLKKAYTILEQAFEMAVAEEGSPKGWGLTGGTNDFESSKNIYDRLSKHLRIGKDCGSSSGCFPPDGYFGDLGNRNSKWVNIDTGALNTYRFTTSSGFAVYIQSRTAECGEVVGSTPELQNGCALIGVDINGNQKPNVIGEDLFIFNMTADGIYPRGSKNHTGDHSFETHCIAGTAWACAAWVINNENLDYLKCKDLSWAGKHECSE